MITKRNITVLVGALLSLGSSLTLAADNSSFSSAVPGWPLLLFLAIVILFHKKIFHGTDIPYLGLEEAEVETKSTAHGKDTELDDTSEEPVNETLAEVITDDDDTNINGIIDLSDDGDQCQASTSKGTRCKRANTLEKTNVVIDGKTYLLTICAQHNNDAFKPYPKLIK